MHQATSSRAHEEGLVQEDGSDGAQHTEPTIDDSSLWVQAVGGRKNGRVYGMGSEAHVIPSRPIGPPPPQPPPTAHIDMTQLRNEVSGMVHAAIKGAIDNVVKTIVQCVLQRMGDVRYGSSAAATPPQ